MFPIKLFRGVAACIFVGLATHAAAQEARIGLNQAPQAVERMLAANQPAAAREVALAAYRVQPDNPIFALSLARAEAAVGNFDAAIKYGRRSWQNARAKPIRYAAARAVAEAYFKTDRLTRSQIWLRRASQVAPNAAAQRAVADDFRTVRNANPWSTSLRFGALPTSNVNNGSSSDIFYFAGLPFPFTISGDGRALSGMAVSAGIDTRYQIHTDQTSATFLTASVNARSYVLSDAARAQAPGAKGSDYADASVQFGIAHNRVLTQGANPTSFSINVGQSWYGGLPTFDGQHIDTRFANARLRHSWTLSDTDRLNVSLSRDVTDKLSFNSKLRSHKTSLTATWTHAWPNSDTFRFGATVTRNDSPTPDSDYKSVTYRVNYDFDKPYNGILFGLGLDVEKRDVGQSIYVTEPRNDTNIGVSLSMQFKEFAFYGFEPVVKLERRRNRSNADLFDRDYSSIGFDLRSSF